MQQEKSPFLEKTVHGEGQPAPNPRNGPKRVGSGAKVGYFPQKLHRMTLLLQRIRLGIRRAHDGYPFRGNFDLLAGSGRRHEAPPHPHGRARRKARQSLDRSGI
jgi:hypothetical protein